MLADLQQTVYPHKWSLVSYKSSAGHGKFAGQRPTFYRCVTQPTQLGVGRWVLSLLSVWLLPKPTQEK